MDKMQSTAEKIKSVSKYLEDNNLLSPTSPELKISKCDKKSNEYRDQGNKFFAKDEFIDAVEMYNKSLCFAKSSVNLALAYANRSAVCFKLNMFSTCMENIELAKLHKYPADKMIKLDERAEKCRVKIAEGAESDETMLKPSGEEFLKLSHPPHPKLPYVADCLDVQSSKVFGRHVVTKKKLLPGEIIGIESPFSKYLKPNHKYKVCTVCLENKFLTLIPCPSTTSAMFCSTKCIEGSDNSSFKCQADIIDELYDYVNPNTRSAVEMFFQSLNACNGSLVKLKEVTENNKKNPDLTIFDVDDPCDKINRYRAIDALNTHDDQRDGLDQLERCRSIAETVNLFLRYTKLGKLLISEDDKDFFRNFLYKHSQIALCNFHGFGMGVGKEEQFAIEPTTSTGSFPFLSLINHSCNGNLYRISDNRRIYLIVLRVIEPGEQLFDSYGTNFCSLEKESRQLELREKYMFDCQCEACMKNLTMKNLQMKFKDKKAIPKKLLSIMGKQNLNVIQAKESFEEICDVLTKQKKFYPCQELIAFETLLQRCFLIFSMSKLILHLFKWKSDI